MKQLSVLIKPASSACNLQCSYCFYHDVSDNRSVKSYGNMKQGVMEKIIDQIFIDLDDGDVMTFAFQGGEPTLAGLAYFETFVNYVKNQEKAVTVKYAIQTNGMFIDDTWCTFFQQHQFLVGLSIDGPKELHDNYRYDLKKRGTHRRVMQTKALFDTYEIDYNVLCVLTNQLAAQPQKMFNFLLKERIQFVQFIPCLDELEGQMPSEFALTPKNFYFFYHNLFMLWKKELDKGNYISIKLFDDIVHLFATGMPSACGMLGSCGSQFVVESDGSTYPCDFYVLDEELLGNLCDETLFMMRKKQRLTQFIATSSKNHLEPMCQGCPYLRMCYGGCKRMKRQMYVDKSGAYCGYQSFLDKHVGELESIARFLNG